VSGVRNSLIFYLTAFLLASVAVSLAAPIVEGVPPRPLTDPKSVVSRPLAAAAPVPVADLFFTRGGIDDAVWIPHKNAVVITTNLTGRYNLWIVPANGGFPLQLTQSDDRQFGLTASPNGKWIVFQSDRAGAEIYDLYETPAAGGAVINLTNTPDVDEEGALFSPDGSLLAFTRRSKDESSNNIAVMDFATHRVRQLTREAAKDYSWSVAAFSHNGKSIVADRTNAAGTESEIWTIDIASGTQTRLTPPLQYNSASDISSDGRYVALGTRTAAGVYQAALLDLRDKSLHLLKPGAWGQYTGHFSPDGQTLIFYGNVDGRTTLYKYDVASGKSERLKLPEGVNTEESDDGTSFSPDGLHLIAGHQSSNTPFDYWTVNVKIGTARQLTQLGLASIDPARLPKAQIVHYKSYDGTMISALLWMPFNLSRNGSAPGVVFPHGGPTSQAKDDFSPNRTALALASRGFVVIAPNVRGSTGYGHSFAAANHADLGGGDLKDEIAGRQFLIDTGYVDPNRIGITGGSYGGFMTLMAISKTPSLWAAAVDAYGIIDWKEIWLHADLPDRQYLESFLGDPVKNNDVYTASSPLTSIKNATAPLLVLQGDNDPQVTRDQAEKVVDVSRSYGHTVEVHFYPGEGHGFFKREDQIDALERTVAWMEKYLKH
jgi:dipeptidyl aminopeptidase/acylaminoacyl peptidase